MNNTTRATQNSAGEAVRSGEFMTLERIMAMHLARKPKSEKKVVSSEEHTCFISTKTHKGGLIGGETGGRWW